MPRNGSGSFSRNYDFTADRDAGSPSNKISADKVDTEFDDVASALTASIAKDGQTTPTADLPMGGYKHTAVATTVSARNQYAPVAVVQDGGVLWVDGGGTADAITATYAPAITALVDGMILGVRATAANATTTPTFSPNGLTARTIVKNGGSALVAGDIVGDNHELLLRYFVASTRWELLNPRNAASVDLNGLTTDTTGGAPADFIPFVDASESNASNKTLVPGFLYNAITGSTADTAPDADADYLLTADASGTTVKKVQPIDLTTDPDVDAPGFKGAPQNAQNAAYTFVIGDAGKHIFHDEVSARTYTIPANASVAFEIGTTITIVNNNGAGDITLAITTDTLRRGDGTAGTGSRTIGANRIATIIKTKSTEWMITGAFT